MNLTGYEYNGFKVYKRTETFYHANASQSNSYNILVQYKNGLPIKMWSQQKICNSNGDELDTWNREESTKLMSGDEFIKNMSDEEVFEIFL